MLTISRIPGRIGTKINGILVLFFFVALTMIILTLYVGRQLEGGAAAINEAGAERMRTYRIAYLLDQSANLDQANADQLLWEAREVIDAFDEALSLLEAGDPDRPLFLPREAKVRAGMQSLRQHWETRLRPLMISAIETQEPRERRKLLRRMDEAVRTFVPMINALVLLVEKSNSRNTNLMWIFQNVLVGFALIGTLFLTYVFTVIITRPVETLKIGMDSMAVADFSVRLPVESSDEFGELASGFNRMADHLQGLYDTLEQRVADKTRDIGERNRELTALYEIAAYLAEPAEIETLCQGVLDKVKALLNAEAGAIRLIDAKTQELHIVVAGNLSPRFLAAEMRLPMDACLCGKASCGDSIAALPQDGTGTLPHCRQEGLLAVAAIPIKSKSQVIGILNLFFRTPRLLDSNETRLLEAVGQHLGAAIDNLRLAVREKDMAVSEERNLIAQELHDSIAQSLAFLNIQAQMLQDSLHLGHTESAREEVARMREGIQESYDHVRELLVHFRIKVDHADLDDSIRSALEKFESQTGIRTAFEKHGAAQVTTASSILQIIHIVQEALSNIRKHAAATMVTVTVALLDRANELVLTIRDNGGGFDPANVVEEGGSHVGLGIMRERARRIGAHLDIEGRAGQGTCVTLTLPGKT